MTPVTLVALAASWGALAGCRSAAEAEAKQSAGRVARAIEVLRAAPNAGKATALAELGKLTCAGPDVCETRAACQAAYSEHVEAVALTEAAKLKLKDGEAEAAAQLLGSAETKLTHASTTVQSCAERQLALKRRYRL